MYAEHGIVTFPIRENKRPAISNYQKLGARGSRILAQSQLANLPAAGFMTNQRNGVTILDVDTTDEKVLADALSRHGHTPLLGRTASGKYHGYYKHNGERRRIRPWRGLPIDLLGAGGFAVAPPSQIASGEYSFIQGTLDDLDQLPTLTNLDLSEDVSSKRTLATDLRGPVTEGERNKRLFGHCMRNAHHVETFDELLDVARTFNQFHCQPPLEDSEVIATAQSAWSYEDRGLNFAGGARGLSIPFEAGDKLARGDGGDAFVLLYHIQRKHWDRDRFILANSFAESLGWTLRRFRRARSLLVEVGRIYLVSKGGRWDGDAPVYRWPTRSDRNDR
jgi:Bifunctional DNA primase/polymerase, N-terminal/Primase C terminal 1 (PriCT-1)